MTDPCDLAKEWGRHHLQCRTRSGKGIAAVVSAEAELPLTPRDAFQLMAHPDNAAIFRGIERCTYRSVLWRSGRADGRQTVEVENESGGCCAAPHRSLSLGRPRRPQRTPLGPALPCWARLAAGPSTARACARSSSLAGAHASHRWPSHAAAAAPATAARRLALPVLQGQHPDPHAGARGPLSRHHPRAAGARRRHRAAAAHDGQMDVCARCEGVVWVARMVPEWRQNGRKAPCRLGVRFGCGPACLWAATRPHGSGPALPDHPRSAVLALLPCVAQAARPAGAA